MCRDLKQMNSRCPLCKGPLLDYDVDHALLFNMELVRRLKKELWNQGPGRGRDNKVNYAVSLSP